MPNPYARDVSHINTLDPYRLQELYKMHPCAEHVVKKLLVAGEREGGKDLDHDISDCIRTLTRWQEMRREDVQAGAIDMTCDATPVVSTLHDWSGVAKDLMWMAKDAGGEVWGYTGKPFLTSSGWEAGRAVGYPLRDRSLRHVNWRESLERRP